MAWIKFHDDFFTHPRTADLPAAAIGLHLRAICYSNQHLLDGKVPIDVIASWGYARWRHSYDILTTLGVWTMSGECIEIRDYLDYQRSREQVLETRQTRAKAGAKGGTAKAAKAKQTPSKVLDGGLAEEKRIETPSSPPPASPSTAPAKGGEDPTEQILQATFARLAQFDYDQAISVGQKIYNPDAWRNAARTSRENNHRADAIAELGTRTEGWHYPIEVELAEAMDPRCGPDDGGRARAEARRDATLTYLHPDQGAA